MTYIADGIDLVLKDWATDRQIEYIDFINQHKNISACAAHFGVTRGTIQNSIKCLKYKAAKQGYSPAHDMVHVVPDLYKVKGVSTYYNNKGERAGQWVKSTLDETKAQAAILATIDGMKYEIPRELPVLSPTDYKEQLINLITLTDSHVGMLATHLEGGADWDIKIAEHTLTSCFEQMVLGAPMAKVCFVNQLGDWLHSDSMLAMTPTSHHVLDVDTRFFKIVQTAIRILRCVIRLALSRHQKVVVLLAECNHDMTSSIWLRAMFKALYENEPRVQIIDSELPYYAYQHGKTMLAFHHGHLQKNNNLPLLFASQFPVMWGETSKRYAHTGHRHHVDEKEHSGMTVTQHATLAARDAYAARGGWIAERQAQCITYHNEYGQVARNIVTPEMVN